MLESYGQTGSWHDHNVMIVPLNEDFTYVKAVEWDDTNYKTLS